MGRNPALEYRDYEIVYVVKEKKKKKKNKKKK